MLQFDRIENLQVMSVKAGWRTVIDSASVPGDEQVNYQSAVAGEQYTLTCALVGVSCEADAWAQLMQIRELKENIRYALHYLDFRGQFKDLSGFYALNEVQPVDMNGSGNDSYIISLSVVYKGNLNERQFATHWEADSETTATWVGLTITPIVAFPNTAHNLMLATTGYREGESGRNYTKENPGPAFIQYDVSESARQWYKCECTVYDTLVAGRTDETRWLQVFSGRHHFTGDYVFQNALMRCIVTLSTGRSTWYLYNTTTLIWDQIGQLRTSLTGPLDALVTAVSIPRGYPSSEELRWVEKRQSGQYVLWLAHELRRGMLHVRMTLTTADLGIGTATYVQVYHAAEMTQLFNSSANGATGGGSLAVDANNAYECAYGPGNIVVGFNLLAQPTSQPIDPGAPGNYLPLGLTWGTYSSKTFFLFAFFWTGNLAIARAAAASVSAQSRSRVRQELVTVPIC